MTGQVKEDILSRFGELGVFVKNGKLNFNPCLLRKNEFLSEEKAFHYVDVNYNAKTIALYSNSMCFTYCQIPIIYTISDQKRIEIKYNDSTNIKFDTLTMDEPTSQHVFGRTGQINQIIVGVLESELK